MTPLSTPPSRSDPANFAARADALMTALPGFVTEANALQADVTAKQSLTSVASASAITNAAAAAVSAAEAAASAGAPLWVSGTTYAQGVSAYSPSAMRVYRRKIAGAGTTDPASDATNWGLVTQDGSGDIARQQGVNLTNATSGSSGITVADSAHIDFGTGNFTLHWEGVLNASITTRMFTKVGTAGYDFYVGGAGLQLCFVFIQDRQFSLRRQAQVLSHLAWG